MEIKPVRLLGLNIASNSRDLKDSEASKVKNLQLLKTGELVRRPGLRVVNISRFDNYFPDEEDADKIQIIQNTSKIKYKQIYTTSREYIDVFGIGNKVWVYDQEANRFNLLYEAPGSAEVDIEKYLGYVLVTSHDSNLAVLRKYRRNIYLLTPGSKIIRSQGDISGSEIDFETEDIISDADLVDMDMDQAHLYSLSDDGANDLVKAISPSGEEISNLAFGVENTFYNDFKVFVGHDIEYSGEIDTDDVDLDPDNKIPTAVVSSIALTTDFKESDSVKVVDDFTANDGYFERDLKSYVKYRYTVERREGTGISSGGFVGYIDTFLKGSELEHKKFTVNDCYAKYDGSAVPRWNIGDDITIYEKEIIGFTYSNPAMKKWTFVKKITLKWKKGYLGIDREDTYYNCWITDTWTIRKDYGTGTYQEKKIAIIDGEAGLLDLEEKLSDDYNIISSPTTGKIYGFIIDYDKATEPYKGVKYYRRLYEITLSQYEYSVKLGSASEKVQVDDPVFKDKVLQETLANGTTYNVDVTLKSASNFTNDIENGLNTLPEDDDSNFEWSWWVNSFEPGAQGKGLDDTVTLASDITSKFKLYAYKPYYRIETLLSSEDKVPLLDENGYPDFSISAVIEPPQTKKSILVLDTSFDVDFNNYGSTGDNEEQEYVITPEMSGSNLNKLIIKKFVKDNFDLGATLKIYNAKSVTASALAKNENFFLYIDDAHSTGYIVSFHIEATEMRVDDILEVPSGTYGNFINMKSFVSHLGQQFVSFLTDTKIYILKFVDDVITVVDSIDISFYDVQDVAYLVSENETLVYCIQDNATTTFQLKLIDNQEGSIEFDETVYSDMEQFIYIASPYPNLVSFIKNNDDEFVLITDKTAGAITDNNRNLIFTIDGINNSAYTKIISDAYLSGIDQIKPQTTPLKPIFSIAAGAPGADRTGKYLYMFVVREYDISSNLLYESYPSVYSIIANVSDKTVTISAQDPLYTAYSASADINKAKLSVYRVKINNVTKPTKLTDFYNLAATGATAIGDEIDLDDNADGTWKLSAGVEDDSDTGDDLSTIPKYIGYSSDYPRCKFVEIFNNIAYVANEADYPNNIYWSDIFDPLTWEPQRTISCEAFTNDPITGLAKNDGVYVFTRDSVNYINGDATNVIMQTLTREAGCVEPKTIQLINGFLVFLSERGFYSIRMYDYKPIDTPVSFKLTHLFTFGKNIMSFYDNYTQEYRIIYDDNKILVYSLITQQWTIFEYPYDKIMIGFTRENRVTDIPENIFIIRNTENGTDTYRMLVEDKFSQTDYFTGDGTNIQTVPIDIELITKNFDMDNGYSEKLFRKVHLETVFGQEVDAYISIDDGEFVQLIEQRKRTYFNTTPLVWFKFLELYGNQLVDYGIRGVNAITHDVEKYVDGKVDWTYKFKDGAYCNVKNIPALPEGFTITNWSKAVKPETSNEINNQIIFANGKAFGAFPEDDVDYVKNESPFSADWLTMPYIQDIINYNIGGFSGPHVISADTTSTVLLVGIHKWEIQYSPGASRPWGGTSIGWNARSQDGGVVKIKLNSSLDVWGNFLSGSDGTKTLNIPNVEGIGSMAIGYTFKVS